MADDLFTLSEKLLRETKLNGLENVTVEGDGNAQTEAGQRLWSNLVDGFITVKKCLIPDLTVKIEVKDAYQANALKRHFDQTRVEWSSAGNQIKFLVSSSDELKRFGTLREIWNEMEKHCGMA